MSEPEIQKTDPAARRKALILLLLGLVGGVILSLNLERWLKENSELILAYPELLCVLLALPLLIGGGWAWWLGGRVITSHRWPPPGMKVIKDTEVELGDRAVRRGVGIRVIAGVIIVGACATAIMMWLLLGSVVKQHETDSAVESAELDDASK